MPQITIRVSQTISEELQKRAELEQLTLSDYLISSALPEYLNEVLTIDKVLNKLKDKEKGTEFTIPSLFTNDEWEHFTKGSRIATGRLFYKKWDKNKDGLKDEVEFKGKNSANIAKYEKLK